MQSLGEDNTVFLHGVSNDGNMFKASHFMSRVAGSYTGRWDAMCKATAGDILNQCHNATSKIRDAISAYNIFLASRPDQNTNNIINVWKTELSKLILFL